MEAEAGGGGGACEGEGEGGGDQSDVWVVVAAVPGSRRVRARWEEYLPWNRCRSYIG